MARPGRNNRKRQRTIEEADIGTMDESSNLMLLQLERQETTAAEIVQLAASQSGAEAMRTMLSLKRVQCYLLEQYGRLLAKASKRLDEQGCWEFLSLHSKEATRAGIGEELRHLTFQSAAEFADKRMAKLTRKYNKK